MLRGRRAPPENPGRAPHPGPPALLPVAGAARGWWAADTLAPASEGGRRDSWALSSAWGPCVFNGGSAKICRQSFPQGSLVVSRSRLPGPVQLVALWQSRGCCQCLPVSSCLPQSEGIRDLGAVYASPLGAGLLKQRENFKTLAASIYQALILAHANW